MKTLKKTILVVCMFGTLFNYANDKKNFSIKLDTKKVKVEFPNVKKGNSIFIKDKYGQKLYSEGINITGNYSKTFNLSSLEKGIYSIELHTNTEVFEKEFYIKNKDLTLKKHLERKINKPSVYTKENTLFISKLNFNKKEVNIEIIYDNETILKESIKSDKPVLNRVYKLLKDKKGKYTVIVKNNGRNFTKIFNL